MELLQTNIFNTEMWVFVLVCIIGAAIFLPKAYKASHSGTSFQHEGKQYYSEENVSITRTWQFWVGMLCVALAIIFILYARFWY